MFKRSRFLLLSLTSISAVISLALIFTVTGSAAPLHVSNSQTPQIATQPSIVGYAPVITGVDVVDTTVIEGGTVSGQWTVEDSPYLVTGTITVPDNSTLIIDPGVRVLFDGQYQFIVNGKLTAIGTPSDSIYFTSSTPAGTWGGMRSISAHTQSRLEYCHFSHGSAEGEWPDNCGGALYMQGTIAAIKNCTFIQNRADKWGGAIYMWSAAPTFSYNLFTQNEAGIAAGEDPFGNAIYIGNGNQLLVNHTTITGNWENSGYALYVAMGTELKMKNSIMWDSFSFSFIAGDINYCNFYYAAGQNDSTSATGSGNMAADPRFQDPENGDYTLRFNSPCIDAAAANSPFGNEPPPNGNRANMGCYGNSFLATQSMPLFSFESDVVVLDAEDVAFDTLDSYPTDGYGYKINTTSGSTNFRIYNVGRQALEISDILFSNDQFSCNFDSLAGEISGTIHVGPDSSIVITLLYEPTELGDVSATMSFVDNDDTSDPEVILTARGVDPEFDINPSLIEFPEIPAGDTYTTSVFIENNANPGSIADSTLYTLYLREITVVANFALEDSLGNRVSKDTIAIGNSVEYTVVFNPQSGGEFADSILIKTNTGIQVLRFTGAATQPGYQFDPDSLEFGVVALGNSNTKTFSVWNPGEAPLILTEFELSDPINYSYEFESDEVAPGDTVVISVTFTPTQTGTYNNKTLNILTNMPDEDEIIVQLFGTGTSQSNFWIGDVGGAIWTSEQSPYFLVGDVTIPSGEILTIEAGVEVRCEGDFSIIVKGALDAQGTPGSPIDFATINQTDSTWSGIDFGTGSSASVLAYCVFHRGAQDENLYGGVMRIFNSSPTISHCEFYDNTADCGGALAVLSWSEAEISNCNFHDNQASYGGALYLNSYSNATVSFSTIIANTALDGGGIYVAGADGEIYENIIQANTATSKAGGIFIGEGASTELYGNDIYENVAVNGGGIVIDWFSKPYIHDELIYMNTASVNGGGIFVTDG
ncbi:choice-of-anchor D domain-containing protein, partial [bacterium]|nr:choice-of-anchor D domain-containing protein [bacterium]